MCDGLNAPVSNVRTVVYTDMKEKVANSEGSLYASTKDTEAPAAIHLGWKWNNRMGDRSALKDE